MSTEIDPEDQIKCGITIDMGSPLVDAMDRLVEAGFYENRSEVIRAAIRDKLFDDIDLVRLLEEFGFKLREKVKILTFSISKKIKTALDYNRKRAMIELSRSEQIRHYLIPFVLAKLKELKTLNNVPNFSI